MSSAVLKRRGGNFSLAVVSQGGEDISLTVLTQGGDHIPDALDEFVGDAAGDALAERSARDRRVPLLPAIGAVGVGWIVLVMCTHTFKSRST